MTHRLLVSAPVAGALGLALVLAAGQVSAQGTTRDTTVRIASSAVVDVSVRTGRVIVRGIEGTSGSVRAGSTEYQLRSTGTTFTLTTRDDDRRDRDWDRNRSSAPLELDVPRGVRLNVSTLSADVEILGITGTVDVRTTSGDIRLLDAPGRTVIETISGDITSTGSSERLRATTVSGDVRIREARGEIDINTTSGDVSISGEQLVRLAVESMSGDVALERGLTNEARVRINTHSGNVTLGLPNGARGQLELSTFNGTLTPDGPLTLLPGDVGGARRGRSVRRYEVGGGGSLQLDISTFNGDIRLRRGNRS